MKVEPYLFFEGRCDEALEFYRTALGAEIIMKMRYSENPEPQQPPRAADPFHRTQSCIPRSGLVKRM